MSKRKVKYRAAYMREGRLTWVYGLPAYIDEKFVQIIVQDDPKGTSVYNCIPETLGQFTGLLDREQKELYEDDVMAGPIGSAMPVYWNDEQTGYYMREPGEPGYVLDKEEAEQHSVIGNIHEDPELIKACERYPRTCPDSNNGILQQMRDAPPAPADIHFDEELLKAFNTDPLSEPAIIFDGFIYVKGGRIEERVGDSWWEVKRGSPRWFELWKKLDEFWESAKEEDLD